MKKSTKKKSTRKKSIEKKSSTRKKSTIGKNITSLPSDIFKYKIGEFVDINKLRQTNKYFLELDTLLYEIASLNYISNELYNITERESDLQKDMEEIMDDIFTPNVSFTINDITFYIFPSENQTSKIYAHNEYDLSTTFTKLTSKKTLVLNERQPTPFTNHEMGTEVIDLFRDVKIKRIPKDNTLSSEHKIFTIMNRLNEFFDNEIKNITFSYTSKDMELLYQELKNYGMPYDLNME